MVLVLSSSWSTDGLGWVTVLFPVLPFSPACSFPSPSVLPSDSVHFLDLILDFAYCSPSQTPLCVPLASFPLSRRILSTPIPVPGSFPGHVLWYLLHIVIHFLFPGVFLDLILCMHILYIFTYPFPVPWSDPGVVLQYSMCCTYIVTLSISGSFVCSLPCFTECILSAQLPYPFPVIWSIPGLILKYICSGTCCYLSISCNLKCSWPCPTVFLPSLI